MDTYTILTAGVAIFFLILGAFSKMKEKQTLNAGNVLVAERDALKENNNEIPLALEKNITKHQDRIYFWAKIEIFSLTIGASIPIALIISTLFFS